MAWKLISPTGSSRCLWLDVTGDDKPDSGLWPCTDGRDVMEVLRTAGPRALGMDVWWMPPPGHRGKALPDFVWQTSMLSLKIVSLRFADLIEDHGAKLERFDLDLRSDRKGTPLNGYVGILEPLGDGAAAAHSYWQTRRSHRLVVSDAIAAALAEAGMTGIRIEDAEGAFPGGVSPED